MIYETDSFSVCEALLAKHAPLLLRVGDELPPKTMRRIPGAWRAPIHPRTVSRMLALRASGQTIGDVARRCGVSWRTAWRLSAP